MIFFKNSWAAMVPPPQDDHKLIAHNYGAVMAVSAEPDGYLNTVEDLGFFKSDRTDIRIFQTQHTRRVVAVEWPVREEQACRVRLRLKRESNSSIGWVMLWSTPDAQTSSTLAHTLAVFLSEKV